MSLHVTDAAELAGLLQFLSEWQARDPGRLSASLEHFVGHPAYGITQLRMDLDRFTFLLGGSDGEPSSDPASSKEPVPSELPAPARMRILAPWSAIRSARWSSTSAGC